MNAKKIAILQIVIALITAFIILFLNYFTTFNSQETIFWIIAIWFVPFSYLNILSARLAQKK